MSLLKDFGNMLLDTLQNSIRTKILSVTLSRQYYHRLALICEHLNEHHDHEVEITPEILAAKVVEQFVDEAYHDSTTKLTRKLTTELSQKLLPELH